MIGRIKMENPYISVFSTNNLLDKTRELDAIWERFITKSFTDSFPEKVRKNVLDSWKRCQEKEINPRQLQAKPALPEFDLHQLLRESELYQAAKPIIDDMFHKLIGTRYLFTLSDEHSHIIYVKGETQLIREAEKMNFALGADWSETSVGTNAIGTSIFTKNPIQIFSAEHFCQGCHPWTCSAAPITHPFTQKIIGAIDFTGFWEDAQPHTLGFAVSIANAIEKQLAHIYMTVNNYLIDVFYQAINKWKHDHILVLNHAFIAVKSSEHLHEKLKVSQIENLQVDQHLQPLFNKLKILSKYPEQQLSATHIKIHNLQVLSIEPIQYMGTVAGYMIVFKDCEKGPHPFPLDIQLDEQWKEVIGHSEIFLKVKYKCQKASLSNVPILLLGESGTGKEKMAQSIHQSSQRAKMPFLALNCGAIQKELIASELFGYETGTFTGASKNGKKGKFEEVNGGTLFLDEIGEMPLDLQVHMLRVLQEKEITRLGSSKPIPVNVRIIAATNKNLYELCKQGRFREDLFFRLNVVTVNIPPLRERKEDISLITDYFLKQLIEKYEKKPLSISEDTLAYFHEYAWPGNIRELQNTLEHAIIFSDSSIIGIEDLPAYILENKLILSSSDQQKGQSRINIDEKKILTQLLIENNYNISAVAKSMNIARSTLYRKLKKHQLNELKKTIPLVK